LARVWWRGKVLKRVRTRRKLTQIELAKKAGVHEMTISRLERGDRQPSMALLQRLAKALGVPVTELLE
jgi:transcriptional regulator with XRE-family HTH domain